MRNKDKTTSNAWYAKFPPDAYALGPFRFEKPITERAFREYLRKWEGCKRLKNVQIWTATS
jgi:hypothetical protein